MVVSLNSRLESNNEEEEATLSSRRSCLATHRCMIHTDCSRQSVGTPGANLKVFEAHRIVYHSAQGPDKTCNESQEEEEEEEEESLSISWPQARHVARVGSDQLHHTSEGGWGFKKPPRCGVALPCWERLGGCSG